MKNRTDNFKNQIKELGRELETKITFTKDNENITLTNEEINSIIPHYSGSLLKSVMKQLDIDSNVEIPKKTIINYKFGLKIESSYEYLDFGNYVVYESEYSEDTKSYKIVCYDKMLYSMTDYNGLKHGQFPMSIKEYEKNLCLDLGLSFKDNNKIFANHDKILESDIYKELGYKYRDIFDELSQVTASTICLDIDDKLENRYINNTNDTINEEYFKDINVIFKEKYGPINSIVLSRSAESDNIYLRDESSIQQNGLCEIKIKDNQIMNFNNRDEFLPDIFDKLNGLEFYLNDFASTGIIYYDLCDKYNVQIFENTYSCIMLNDEICNSQGLEENVFTERLNESITDYSKADKTDRRINQAYIIVDKQNQKIESLTSNVEEFDSRIAKTEQTVEKIAQTVSGTYDFSREASGNNILLIEKAQAGNLLELHITGEMELLYPNDDLYPADDLYPLDSYLIIEDSSGNKNKFRLPIRWLYTTTKAKEVDGEIITEVVSDEFIIEKIYNEESKKYESKCKIIRRVGINEDDSRFIMSNEQVEDLGIFEITLYKGTNKIYLESFESMNYKIKYAILNEVTEDFATKTELSSSIEQSEKSIDLSVNKKLENYTTEESMKAQIKLLVDNIQLSVENGTTVAKIELSVNGQKQEATIDLSGLVRFTDLKNAGTTEINGANITTGKINCDLLSGGTISGQKIQGGEIYGTKLGGATGEIGGWNLDTSGLSNGNNFIHNNGYSNIFTYADMVMLRNYMLGKIDFSEEDIKKYDLNKDGKVDSADLLLMRQKILNI